MAVGNYTLPMLHPIAGIELGTACAGIKKIDHPDLVLLALDQGCKVAGVYTRNAFCAAPVVVTKKHLQESSASLLMVNTGNANAGTGEAGLQACLTTCSSLAALRGISTNSVLPFSTGVIGELLPADKICAALPSAISDLNSEGWRDAASGILTTDTYPKGVSKKVEIAGSTVTITGIAKGAGMIRPDMATMLAFVATDADISDDELQSWVEECSDKSFNRITVDGDTSTNDCCMLIATGKSNVKVGYEGEDSSLFKKELTSVFVELAQTIVKDGEGATKFVTIKVDESESPEESLAVAYTIAESPLVKTALFASDPNWGRILAAVGRAGVERLDISKICIFLDEVCIVKEGGLALSYLEEMGQKVMQQDEITILVTLGRGHHCETVWTTDLSYDYIKINAEYRT